MRISGGVAIVASDGERENESDGLTASSLSKRFTWGSASATFSSKAASLNLCKAANVSVRPGQIPWTGRRDCAAASFSLLQFKADIGIKANIKSWTGHRDRAAAAPAGGAHGAARF